MHFATLLTAAVLVLCQAPDTLGVSDTLDASEIVVNGREISHAGDGTVRTRGSDEVERMGARRLEEVLRTFAGVSVKDYGGVGGMKTVSIRNFGSQHTSVTYDGMSVGDALTGQVDINRFCLENLASISVSIGPTDDIFVSARESVSAGTLRLESSRPDFRDSPMKLDVGFQGGSFLTFEPYFTYSQKLGGRWWMTAGSRFQYSRGNYPYTMTDDGASEVYRREGSEVFSFTPSLSLNGDFGRAGRFSFRANYHDSSRDLPGAVALYTQDPTEHLWERNLSAEASYLGYYTFSDGGRAGKFSVDAGYSLAWTRYTDVNKLYMVPVDDHYMNQQWNVRARCLFPGVGRFSFSLAQDLYIDHLDDSLLDCPFPTRETSYTAFSAKYQSRTFTAAVTMTALVACEQLRAVGENPAEKVPTRARFVPSAFVSWRCCDFLRIRASIRDGYRLPTFNDLYYSKIGTNDLRPEKALQSGMGMSWSASGSGVTFSADIDGYFNYVKDKIVASPSLFIWKMRNLGRVLMAGCDNVVSLSYAPTSWLTMAVNASYSYQWAVDRTDPSAKNFGHQIPYTPRHSGNLGFCVVTRWIDLSYSLTAVGERYTMGQNIPANSIPAYFDHGLSAGHSFHFAQKRGGHPCSLRIYADGLNLSGVNYEIIKSYPMPGREFRAGVKFSM